MMLPLVTVITPHYNRTSIYETIASVLLQDYPHFQYIVVCDGSTCVTAQDVRHYLGTHAQSHVEWNVIEHMQNEGTVKAMNAALRMSQGKYIYNLADDDVFADDRVLIDWTRHFEKTGAIISTAKRGVYRNIGSTPMYYAPKEKEIRQIRKLPPEALFKTMEGSNYIFGSCTARCKECVEKYGLFDEAYRLIEDYSMNMRLLRQGVRFDFYDREVVRCKSNGTSAPAHMNPIYLQDSDRIFEKEILPYTKNRGMAKVKYGIWRLKYVRHGTFIERISKEEKNWRKALLYIIYPENLLRSLKEKSN